MDPTWLSTAALDATWPGILLAFGALGAVATAVVLARQATPRTRIDPDLVARRRDAATRAAGRRLAH